MKKSTAGITLAAIAGFAVLSAAPASAATLPFANCTAAANEGVYNIPRTSAAYSSALDREGDGIGCEGSIPYDDSIVQRILGGGPTPQPTPPPTPPAPGGSQMRQTPSGWADAGVSPDTSSNLGMYAAGGGLVLVAAAGGGLLLRRRSSGSSTS